MLNFSRIFSFVHSLTWKSSHFTLSLFHPLKLDPFLFAAHSLIPSIYWKEQFFKGCLRGWYRLLPHPLPPPDGPPNQWEDVDEQQEESSRIWTWWWWWCYFHPILNPSLLVSLFRMLWLKFVNQSNIIIIRTNSSRRKKKKNKKKTSNKRGEREETRVWAMRWWEKVNQRPQDNNINTSRAINTTTTTSWICPLVSLVVVVV